MTNRVVYDGGKSKYEEYRRVQEQIHKEFAAYQLNFGSIVIFEDKYYLYTWDLQEHRSMFDQMSQKDVARAIKDGRIK